MVECMAHLHLLNTLFPYMVSAGVLEDERTEQSTETIML